MKCPRCFFSNEPVDDVSCTLCSRNFTRKELVEVALLGLLYLVACRFGYYLFTGDFFSLPYMGGVFFPVRFSTAFVDPVSLADHPWHVLTLGLTMSLAVAVPVLVARYYDMRSAVVVAVVGGYHVAAPFFFVFTVLGVLLAGRPFDNKKHLDRILVLSIAPSVAYLLALTLSAMHTRSAVRALLAWGVTAAFSVTFVWWSAWFSRRRGNNARFVLWAFAAQLVAAMILFGSTVGFARLEYSLQRQKYRAVGKRYDLSVHASGKGLDAAKRRPAAVKRFDVGRTEAIDELTTFVEWFPHSLQTPLALFERAAVRNLGYYFSGGTPDMLLSYGTRVSPEAIAEYRLIRADFPGSPAAPMARLQMVRYYLQNGRIDDGLRELNELIDFCAVKIPDDFKPGPGRPDFLRWRARDLTPAGYTRLLYDVLVEARRKRGFIERNSDYNRIPLMLHYQIDEHRDDQVARLEQIVKWFSDSRLADNVKLRLWVLDPVSSSKRSALAKLTELEGLYADYPAGDAAPEMLLRLGRGYFERDLHPRAGKFLRLLLNDFPDSTETVEARKILKRLENTKILEK